MMENRQLVVESDFLLILQTGLSVMIVIVNVLCTVVPLLDGPSPVLIDDPTKTVYRLSGSSPPITTLVAVPDTTTASICRLLPAT